MSKNVLRIASVDELPAHLRAAALVQMADQLWPRPGINQEPAARPQDQVRNVRRRSEPEHKEQKAFIKLIDDLAEKDRRYKMAAARTFAIPNGGHRGKAQAGKLKAEGVRAGVADLFLALPVNGIGGLFIEMKSLTGYPSREQREWLNESFDLGYAVACCRGATEAMIVWLAYVDGSL